MELVGLVGAAALGLAFEQLRSEIWRVKDNVVMFKPTLEELEETLDVLAPVIQEIEELNRRLNGPDYRKETNILMRLMEDGKELVSKCSNIGRWNFLKQSRYQQKLVELDYKILRFHNLYMQAHMARDQKQTLLAVKEMFMSLNLAPDRRGYSNLTMGLTSSTLSPSNQMNHDRVTLAVELDDATGASTVALKLEGQPGQSSGGNCQREVYQKIIIMKEMYLPELNEMYQKTAAKLHQHDSLPQQLARSNQLEKLKIFKTMLERMIGFLQISESNILPSFKDKLGSYEKQILNFVNTNRPRKGMSSLQPGQLPTPSMHSMSQPQSQLTLQMQSHENQINSQLQPTNIQGSVAAIPQNNMSSLQHNSMSGVSIAPQSMMMNSLYGLGGYSHTIIGNSNTGYSHGKEAPPYNQLLYAQETLRNQLQEQRIQIHKMQNQFDKLTKLYQQQSQGNVGPSFQGDPHLSRLNVCHIRDNNNEDDEEEDK